jgi:uncharacterized protein YggU (UPF0235/DUF167 family)
MNISIIVHTNSKKPKIEKDSQGLLHVYVGEQPQEGKANEAVRTALAKHLGIAKSSLLLWRGIKSKHKIFKII